MSLADEISNWMRAQVEAADVDGITLGLSGGVDSACVAGLAQRAVGRGAVIGVLMPCHSDPIDAQYAYKVARTFDLETITVDLTPVYDAFITALPPTSSRLVQANLKPRLRMTTLYYVANTHNYLVAGTSNKSELMVGYFTKHGDSGVDLSPLSDLYKREVFDLARELGVPQAVIDRPPTAGLWPGQTDEGEMGLTYDALERALTILTTDDRASRVDDLYDHSVDQPTLEKVRKMMVASAHKRTLPPAFNRGME
jgi:NAD+ synthase